MMGSTNLTGAVPCELFDNHELRTLMISINQLEGTLPACVLAVSGYIFTYQLVTRLACLLDKCGWTEL
jgi:hypothetical protein